MNLQLYIYTSTGHYNILTVKVIYNVALYSANAGLNIYRREHAALIRDVMPACWVYGNE